MTHLPDMTAAELAAAYGAPPPAEDRPVIDVIPGRLPEVVDAAEQALLAAETPVHQSGGRLVAIAHDDPRDTGRIRRPPGAPRIVPVSPVHLREVLTRVATWRRYDARAQAMRAVDCPMAVAAALAERGAWRLRELVGYVEAPTVRDDGTPLVAPGYDPATGLYLLAGTPAVTLPPPEQLTHDDAAAAVDTLAGVVASWPYVDEGDRAAAVAMLLTVLIARSVDAVPMTCITAPAPGTGKSLLADVAAVLATGRRPPS